MNKTMRRVGVALACLALLAACGKKAEPKQQYQVSIHYINMIDPSQTGEPIDQRVESEKLLEVLTRQLELEYEIVENKVVYHKVRGFDLTGYAVQVTNTEEEKRFRISPEQMVDYQLNPYKTNNITFAVVAEEG